MNNTLTGKLTSRGNLNGNVNTIVFAHNYNDLTNKPQINNVTLQGNKTASELGLATPSDITVTSVNEQTGDVVLSGSDIDYSVGMSVNAKIDDLESQIIGSGVQSVNGMTGNVTLTSNDINYSTGVTIKNKIDSVEGEIPSIYVSSVNGTSGAVTLTGSNINYSEGLSLNDKIDAVEGEIPVINYPVTSVNSKTGAVNLTGADIPLTSEDSTKVSTAIGDLSDLTTSVTSSLVGAVNEVVSTKATTGSAITFAPETGITAAATSAVINKTVLLNLTFSGSFTQNTWKKIGAMNVTPSIPTIYVAGIHSSDGLYAGMIQIRSDNGIYFYPKIAISGTVGCTANFNIT